MDMLGMLRSRRDAFYTPALIVAVMATAAVAASVIHPLPQDAVMPYVILMFLMAVTLFLFTAGRRFFLAGSVPVGALFPVLWWYFTASGAA